MCVCVFIVLHLLFQVFFFSNGCRIQYLDSCLSLHGDGVGVVGGVGTGVQSMTEVNSDGWVDFGWWGCFM